MATKAELLKEAEAMGVEGADKMTKAQLEEALKADEVEQEVAGESYNPQQRRHANL